MLHVCIRCPIFVLTERIHKHFAINSYGGWPAFSFYLLRDIRLRDIVGTRYFARKPSRNVNVMFVALLKAHSHTQAHSPLYPTPRFSEHPFKQTVKISRCTQQTYTIYLALYGWHEIEDYVRKLFLITDSDHNSAPQISVGYKWRQRERKTDVCFRLAHFMYINVMR